MLLSLYVHGASSAFLPSLSGCPTPLRAPPRRVSLLPALHIIQRAAMRRALGTAVSSNLRIRQQAALQHQTQLLRRSPPVSTAAFSSSTRSRYAEASGSGSNDKPGQGQGQGQADGQQQQQQKKKASSENEDRGQAGRSPFAIFVEVLKEELQKSRELQDNVRQLQGTATEAMDSEAMKKAKAVYERARVGPLLPPRPGGPAGTVMQRVHSS